MGKLKIKKNDMVKVIAGKDKGKVGKVLKVLAKENRIIVERVNFSKRHTRPNPSKQIQGGILEKEAPLQASNCMVICPDCGLPTRVGKKTLEDGSRVRICKHCKGVLDQS